MGTKPTAEAKQGSDAPAGAGSTAPGDASERASLKNGAPDQEALRRLFPDPAAVFTQRPEPLQQVLTICDVVLDTNVLLIPYSARSEGFAAIKATLTKLADDSRLFIPARVAREYARSRPDKIKELLQSIMNQKSQMAAPTFRSVPLIEGRPETKQLKESEESIRKGVADYHEALQAVHDMVREWQAHDPVSDLYAQIFSAPGTVVELADAYDDIRKDLTYRVANKVPPGYKDASKDDGGEGDLIIWRTILQIGSARKRHLIFVSGDEKADWQHRTNGVPILPRVELVDEYRRATNGMSFHIVSLSALLQVFQNTQAAVEQVETAEAQQRLVGATAGEERHTETVLCPFCETANDYRLAAQIGASAKPLCVSCGRSFHVHRVREGVLIRRPASNPYRRARRIPSQAAMDAVEAMKEWFLGQYMDPADGVPHDSGEGGYQYVNGGPFEADEVLMDKFGRMFPRSTIREALRQIQEEYDGPWVRRHDY